MSVSVTALSGAISHSTGQETMLRLLQASGEEAPPRPARFGPRALRTGKLLTRFDHELRKTTHGTRLAADWADHYAEGVQK